jgi:hypothetical protein
VRQARCSECDDYDVGAKAERRAVLLRVAGELRKRAAQRSGTHPMAIVEVGVLLQLADQYEREAAEVK